MWPTDDALKWDYPTNEIRKWNGEGDFWDTPTGATYLRDNPRVAYNLWANQLGFDMTGQDARTRYMRQYYDQDQLNYLSGLAVNPTLDYYRDWLPNQMPNMQAWEQRWNQLTPNQRGDRQAAGQPIRYIPW